MSVKLTQMLGDMLDARASWFRVPTQERGNDKNVTTKRPGTGISPLLWDKVMGQKASRAFVSDELIER